MIEKPVRVQPETALVGDLKKLITEDRSKANELFRLYLTPLTFLFFFDRCKNLDLASELTQDTMVRFCPAVRKTQPEYRIEQLLIVTASRRWADYCSRRKRIHVDLCQAENIQFEEREDRIRFDLEVDVLECAGQLPELERCVYHKNIECKSSIRTIAAEMKIKRNKADLLVKRMLSLMRDCLTGKGWSAEEWRNQ